jgi:hypothetical protein
MRRTLWLLLVAACGTPGPTDESGKASTRTPEADRKYKEVAARGEVRLGMTRQEVRTALGEPKRTKRTTYRRRSATCWSYEYRDIYFDDEGFVIGWQSLIG